MLLKKSLLLVCLSILLSANIKSGFYENEMFEFYNIKTVNNTTINYWECLKDAIVHSESRGNDSIMSIDSALGSYQITRIYIEEVNRIPKQNKFNLDDRYSRTKSELMFEIMQKHHNPDKDILLAIRLHHPNGGEKYVNTVLKQFAVEIQNKTKQ